MKRLASRIAKLEQRARPTARVRSVVVEIDAATRKPTGPMPTGGRVMVVTTWPNDEAWSRALRRQQAQLMQNP